MDPYAAEAMKCDKCGRFHDRGPGSAWQLVYSGGTIPEPDQCITRCRDCVARYGPFSPQIGIKPEYSCGVVPAGEWEALDTNLKMVEQGLLNTEYEMAPQFRLQLAGIVHDVRDSLRQHEQGE